MSEYASVSATTTDVDIAQLVDAEKRSEDNVRDLRAYVQRKLLGTDGLDIVAFGSLARREWTDQSDFDYLVVVHRLHEAKALREALQVAERAREKLEADEPGATGMFGVIVSASELIARIGLETDTNQTLTRRLLMLEESVSLYNQVEHATFLSSMLDRYLIEYQGRSIKTGVPRFLLNDVVRHWRTVAVDYQAKNWQRVSDEGWGLRYLKLRVSRKLAFAGTLAPLLVTELTGEEPTAKSLLRRMTPPPLVRLAALHEHLGAGEQQALTAALQIAGRFNRQLNDADFREDAGAVTDPDQDASADFKAALADADSLQDQLTEIFAGPNSPLRSLTHKYLIF